MPKRYRKEPQLVWVAVGTNSVDAPSTWFYTFDSHHAAWSFVDRTQPIAPTIMWIVYPCQMDSVATAFDSFQRCLTPEETE